MILGLFLLCPLFAEPQPLVVYAQEAAPSTPQKQQQRKQQPADKQNKPAKPNHGDEGAEAWWKSLSDEEKKAARKRWKDYRELNPEARAEMDRRAQLLREQMREVLSELTPEQRAEFEALPSQQRMQRMHQMLRVRLEERAKNGESNRELPPPPPGHKKRPLEERLEWSKERFDASRLERMQRDLRRAVKEGWVTEQAAASLKGLPADQLEPHMERIRHLRMLNWLDEKGGWKRLGVPEKERDELRALAPDQFIETMRERGYVKKHRRGGGGPREGGPPRRRPGGERDKANF